MIAAVREIQSSSPVEEVQKGGEWSTLVLILVIVRSESAPI